MANIADAFEQDINIEIELPSGQITHLTSTQNFQRCAQLQQKIDHLNQEALDKDRNHIQSIDNLSRNLEKANQHIQALTEQLKQKENECSTLQAEKNSLDYLYKQLGYQNQNLQTQSSDATRKYEELKKEKENADKYFHQTLNTQSQQIHDLSSQLGETQRQNEEYQTEISSLQNQLANLQSLYEKQKSQFSQEKLTHKSNFDSLIKEKTALSNQIEEKKNEINTLQSENFELRNQNQQNVNKINELEKARSENEIQINTKNDLLNQLSTNFHQEQQRLNDQLTNAQQNNTELSDEKLKLQGIINQLQSGIANLVSLCLASNEDMMSGIPQEDNRQYWNQIRDLSNSPYLYETDRFTDFDRISQFINQKTELVKHQNRIIMAYQNKYINSQNNYRDFIKKSFSYFRRAHYCENELLNVCSSMQNLLNQQDSKTFLHTNQIYTTLTEVFHDLYEGTQKNGDDFITFIEQSKDKLDSLPKQLDAYQNEINRYNIDYYNDFKQCIKDKIKDSSNQDLVKELVDFKFDICKNFEKETKDYQTDFGNDQEKLINRDDLPELQLNCDFDHQSTIELNQNYFGGIRTFLEQAKSSMSNLTGAQQDKEGAKAQTEQMKQELSTLEKDNRAKQATIDNLRTVLNLSARLCQQNYEDELEHHQQARTATTTPRSTASSRGKTTKSTATKNATDTATEPKAPQSDSAAKPASGDSKPKKKIVKSTKSKT